MMFPQRWTAVLGVASLGLGVGWAGRAAETAVAVTTVPGTPSPAALQAQIDELREGQARLLQELRELRATLSGGAAPAPRSDVPSRPPPASEIRLNLHGESFRGSGKARVAIVAYSDFACSHCARFATDVFPQLDRDYLRTGRVRYYFHDLPDLRDAESVAKARTARCAGELGKFWEMHDLLFAVQSRPPAEQEPAVLAKTLGLDPVRLEACLAGDRHREVLERVSAGAVRLGLLGTPAFLVGTVSEDGNFFQARHLRMGAEKASDLSSLLDEVLASLPKD